MSRARENLLLLCYGVQYNLKRRPLEVIPEGIVFNFVYYPFYASPAGPESRKTLLPVDEPGAVD